jgi:hypothetical protein
MYLKVLWDWMRCYCRLKRLVFDCFFLAPSFEPFLPLRIFSLTDSVRLPPVRALLIET